MSAAAPDPLAALEERERDGFASFRPSDPAPGRYYPLQPEKPKAERVEELLAGMGDMDSHYDIEPRDGGFALVRTFEIDDAVLAEMSPPPEQVFGWTPTLDEMHERILDPGFVPELFPRQAPNTPIEAPEHGEGRRTMSGEDGGMWDLAQEHAAVEQALNERDEPLTIEAMQDNPWHAVARDLPDDASAALAAEVVRVTEDLERRASEWAKQAVNPAEQDHWLDLAELSQTRREEAALAHDVAFAREAWREPTFSRATIDADPWTAVHLDIPENADPELLAYARGWASDLSRYAEGNGALAEPQVDPERFGRQENIRAARERVEALDARLSEENRREAAPEIEISQPHGEFLSGEFIARRASESLARTTEMLLGVIIGYFVSEPEPTPEQARLAARANAERNEAMELETAQRESAAALDGVNLEIDHHRPHVEPKEPMRPDSVYERYPGLTRDTGDDSREQERDRAFYDTGIERGR
jgi:hypothetical protein